ncbi:MAG: MFS transporter, partial [Planctomycetes bacterium]|nr:MFS transporter [Planctomycetota bacterium]
MRRSTGLAMAAAVFLAYLAVALPLAILSVHITREWGLSSFLGGVGVGATFLSTILTRKYAGGLADRRGGKRCFAMGTAFFAMASAFSVLAAWSAPPVGVRYALLLAGRLLLGVGESAINTGMVSWMVAMQGPARSGRVMALLGMSMYAAFAVGSPAGFSLYQHFGFASLMWTAAACPIAGYLLVRRVAACQAEAGPARESFLSVVGRIWRYGMGLCLQGVGFSILGAFLGQMFLEKGWAHAGWGIGCFGIGFVLLRLLAGHLPDRIGGLPVAVVSYVVEVGGLMTIWLSGSPVPALIGAFVTGCGCSMIFPALGREVILSTPPSRRGTGIACYSAFQDLAYCIAGPTGGLLADRAGTQNVFLLAGGVAAAGLGLTVDP